MDMNSPRVGLIGLGLMGAPVARNLLQAGVRLTCNDLDASAVAVAVEQGATAAATAAEVAADSDVILVIVPTNEDAREVVAGSDGVLSTARPGSVVVLCSSLRPDTCAELEERAREAGVHLIDAPMTGGIRGAEQGTMTLLVGGDVAALQRARPALELISSTIHHLGGIGAGQVGKTVNNLIHWGEVVVITEALALGAKLGVDVSRMRRALMDASVDSRTLRELEKMKFTWHAKDLEDAMDMAATVGHRMPAAEMSREEMLSITPERVARLLADEDWDA
ncbi:NAD(P)-dependent oxidoreductase [Egicoccus sp. AB-alg6-2]|uniref:NAD(P)-dependent oxidoreductase n=1 Tax=Egicoccus sp. AB-alg6-2 TaxID=3242692 RepID=UPI00359D39A3